MYTQWKFISMVCWSNIHQREYPIGKHTLIIVILLPQPQDQNTLNPLSNILYSSEDSERWPEFWLLKNEFVLDIHDEKRSAKVLELELVLERTIDKFFGDYKLEVKVY